MRKLRYLLSVLFFLIGMTGFGLSQEKAESDSVLKTRLGKIDKGPAKIDVSKYPKEQQENYQVFSQKCSKCHTLSRPINSDYALPEEWERYVKRMMRKPGSGIGSKDGKKIYEFLTYDSKIRKKDLYEKKLKESSESQSKEKK